MILTTERLILRPWEESDAPSLYEYAKDGRVGPIAGWPVHESEAQSLECIRTVFAHEEVYAVAKKEDNRAIGMVGLLIGKDSNFVIADNEAEVAYWIGVPFWGQGLIPEAIKILMRHAYEDLQMQALWCGYFVENVRSFKVQAKCGFKYHHTEENKFNQFLGDYYTGHVSYLSRKDWLGKA